MVMESASVNVLDRWIILNFWSGLIAMSGPVEKKCKCGHRELDHKFRDASAKEIIDNFIEDPQIELIHHPDKVEILGFKLNDGTYYTYQKAMSEIEWMQNNRSRCATNLFMKDCECENYRPDNLKYLEDLDERSAS